MIYLDNAATTYPKPASVRAAVSKAVSAANPGRSGHRMSLQAGEDIFRCRKKTAEFFGVPSPECVSFTPGCTMSANMVLKGLLKKGGHVVVSDMEHNAVMRPLNAMKRNGVSYTCVRISENDDETLSRFREALRENTRLVICNHVSNVWGIKLPVERISAMCRQYGIPFMLDAAQSAGVFNINAAESGFDFVCAAGHKGLYAPMGVGVLTALQPELLDTIVEGGTGSGSRSFDQPDYPPDKFESGTPNYPGIMGLSAGLDFVNGVSLRKIRAHEQRLIGALYDRLSSINGVLLYTPRPDERGGGVLSFNVGDQDSESVARYLSDRAGIAVRAGLHCAPLAHEHFGTQQRGAVRASVSYFNQINDIYALSNAVRRIASSGLR